MNWSELGLQPLARDKHGLEEEHGTRRVCVVVVVVFVVVMVVVCLCACGVCACGVCVGGGIKLNDRSEMVKIKPKSRVPDLALAGPSSISAARGPSRSGRGWW